MRLLAPTLVVLIAAGCSRGRGEPTGSTARHVVGSRVAWRGVAANYAAGGAFLVGPDIYVDVPDKDWPSEIVGRCVEVTGTIVERDDLPVFIDAPNELPIAGIPVPPGTDLHEASKRYVLEDVHWTAAGEGG